jgi:hypothetical protein
MKVQIPTDINDITVEEYLKFTAVNKEDADEEFLIHKTISVFCGIDMKDVLNIDLQDAIDISQEIYAVLNQNAKFQDKFKLDGVEYGFIPNLEELSLGEYIDLETYLKEEKDLHKVAAVMYRPIIKQYKDLYDIEGYSASIKRQELMKRAPIGVISQAVVFFYNIANELLMDSPHYLENQAKEVQETIQQEVNLLKNTDGLTPSTYLAKVMSETLTK